MNSASPHICSSLKIARKFSAIQWQEIDQILVTLWQNHIIVLSPKTLMDKFAERICGSQIGGITVDHETPLRKGLTQKTKVSKEKTKKLRIKILSNDASPRYFITTIHQHRIFFVAPSPHFHKAPSKLANPTAKVIQVAFMNQK